MQNYSQVYADTLALYESNIVPADQGDAGKGQVNARAVYTIYSTMNPNVGYIKKNPGQTQYYGISVDACQDKSDGTGADYLTDVDLGNGTREIRVAYTPYSGAASPPDTNWLQPNASYLNYPGPLVLKGSVPTPEPEPTPPPNSTTDEKLNEIINQNLVIIDKTNQILAQEQNNTNQTIAAVQQVELRLNEIKEEFEDSLKKLIPLLDRVCRFELPPPTVQPQTSGKYDQTNKRR